jgi:hypothetical protein
LEVLGLTWEGSGWENLVVLRLGAGWEDMVGLGEALEVWMGTMEDSRGEDMEVLGEAEEVWKEAMEVLM